MCIIRAEERELGRHLVSAWSRRVRLDRQEDAAWEMEAVLGAVKDTELRHQNQMAATLRAQEWRLENRTWRVGFMRLRTAFSRRQQRRVARMVRLWCVNATRALHQAYAASFAQIRLEMTVALHTDAQRILRGTMGRMRQREAAASIFRWKRHARGHGEQVRGQTMMRRVGVRWKMAVEQKGVTGGLMEWRRCCRESETWDAISRQKQKAESCVSRVRRRWLGLEVRRHLRVWNRNAVAGYRELLQARSEARQEVAVAGTEVTVRMLDNGTRGTQVTLCFLRWDLARRADGLQAARIQSQQYMEALTELTGREAIMMKVRLQEMEVERSSWTTEKERIRSEMSANRGKFEAGEVAWHKKIKIAEDDRDDALEVLAGRAAGDEQHQADHIKACAVIKAQWEADVTGWRQEAENQREEVTRMWQTALREKADLLAAHVREQQATEARWLIERSAELAAEKGKQDGLAAEGTDLRRRIKELMEERTRLGESASSVLHQLAGEVSRIRGEAAEGMAEMEATICMHHGLHKTFKEGQDAIIAEHRDAISIRDRLRRELEGTLELAETKLSEIGDTHHTARTRRQEEVAGVIVRALARARPHASMRCALGGWHVRAGIVIQNRHAATRQASKAYAMKRVLATLMLAALRQAVFGWRFAKISDEATARKTQEAVQRAKFEKSLETAHEDKLAEVGAAKAEVAALKQEVEWREAEASRLLAGHEERLSEVSSQTGLSMFAKFMRDSLHRETAGAVRGWRANCSEAAQRKKTRLIKKLKKNYADVDAAIEAVNDYITRSNPSITI